MSKARRMTIGILSFLYLSVVSVVPVVFAADFNADVVNTVEDHAVAIAVYYYMDDAEYQRRILRGWPWSDWGIRELAKMVPLGQVLDSPSKCVAYIGAGGLLKDDYIITVRHLFVHDANTTGSTIWVFQHQQTEAIEAEIIAISEGADYSDDYAVIKLKKSMGLKGLKISKKEAKSGSQVIFIGSTGGMAFHKRFGFISDAQRYFRKDADAILHLSIWEQFKFLMIFPGGRGDSGGYVTSKKGEIVGLMYCGISIEDTQYVFSNPVQKLWGFLKKYDLECIGR